MGVDAKTAELNSPVGLAMDGAQTLYIADELNHRIRQVVASSQIINTVVGNGTAGYSGDGGVGTAAELNSPLGVTVDAAGNFYIADSVNDVIRKVTSTDQISTVAGNQSLGGGFSGDTGAPLNATLNGPSAVALDSAGNLYIADTANNRIRKVSLGTGTNAGTITTFAGSGGTSFSGDGLPAVDASLNAPRGLAFDAAGNLYIADSGNHAIRMVSAKTLRMSTVAGTGSLGYNGDNIAATSAQLNYPLGIAFDSAGNLYIADSQNFRIRKVVNGIMTTIGGTGQPGYGGDGLYSTRLFLTSLPRCWWIPAVKCTWAIRETMWFGCSRRTRPCYLLQLSIPAASSARACLDSSDPSPPAPGSRSMGAIWRLTRAPGAPAIFKV